VDGVARGNHQHAESKREDGERVEDDRFEH
jgi:hypothetical protein